MTQLIDRAAAWLGTNNANGRLVADEALAGNLRRLRWLLPLIMVLNIVSVVVFWWDGGNVASPQRAWKNAIGWTHLCMAVWMLVSGLVAYWLSQRPAPGRTGRWLQFAVPMSLILFTVVFTVIDQQITPNISPFLVGCAFVGLLLLTRPAVTLVLFVAGYAFFYAGLGLTQHDPVQLLSNRASGVFAAVLGLVLGLVLWQKNTVYVLLQRELKSRNLALLQQQEELVWLAKRDALTGLFNRGEFLRLAEAELLRAQRHRTDTSAIMVDMDYFKNINDVYGHPAGDSALKHAATCLLAGVRATDVVARVGGEEFMVLLPQTSSDSAVMLAQKLLRGLQQSPARISSELELAITASFGVGTLPAGQSGSVAWLYAASDHALYEAKRLGRNRVEKTEPDASLTASDFQRMRRR
jgi:diguanylate cyclase (GGDEF)-like protein